MNIQIIGDNFDISSGTKTLINEKLGYKLDKLLSHFSSDITNALVRIQKTKLDEFMVNFDMNLPGKKHIYAANKNASLGAAVIELEEEIERQIKKYKENE